MDNAIQSGLISVFGALGTTVDGVIPASSARGLLATSAPGLYQAFENEVVRFNSNNLQAQKVARGANSYIAPLVFPLDVGDNGSLDIGHFLMLLFGKTTMTGSGSNRIHTFTTGGLTADQKRLKDLRLIIGMDRVNFLKKYGSGKVNSLSISIDAEANTVECTAEVWFLTEAAVSIPTSFLYSATSVLSGNDVTTMINSLDANIKTMDITFNRMLEYARTQNGSGDPTDVITKGLEFTVSGSAYYSDTSDAQLLDNFRTNPTTTVPFSCVLADPADTTNRKLTITADDVRLTTVTGPNASGDDIVMVDFAGTAIDTGTDYVVAELRNGRTTAYDTPDT